MEARTCSTSGCSRAPRSELAPNPGPESRAIVACLFDLGLRRAERCDLDRVGRRGRPGGPPRGRATHCDLDSREGPDGEGADDPPQPDRGRPGRVDRGPRQRTRPALPSPRRSQAGPGRSTLRGIGPPDHPPIGQGRRLAPGRSPPWLTTQRGDIGPRCWPRSPRRRRFTRHRSLEMVLRYDDMRRDVAGEIARDLAGRRDQGREV